MKKRKFTLIALAGLILTLALAGCLPVTPAGFEATRDSFRVTQQAITVEAILAQTLTAIAPQPTATATLTPISPTDTPTRTPEPWPTLTDTPLPTHTPLPTNTPYPTATPIPIPCNRAGFVDDITIEDGSLVAPRSDFIKVWRLENTGSCTWTQDYALVFSHGDRMSGDRYIPMPRVVPPGQEIDLAVNLIAPRQEGNYRGYWHFNDDLGRPFGIGLDASAFFWVDIQVAEIESNYSFDFAADFCRAEWQSSPQSLACPGDQDDAQGFVLLLENPALENRQENEPTLWMHPNEAPNGYIEGRYPNIRIDEGDRFRAWVGCLEGYEDCDLTFYLDAMTTAGNAERYTNLGEWQEVYEGQVTEIDLDLSVLEGEVAQFILGVAINNTDYDDAHGFWFVPRIVRQP